MSLAVLLAQQNEVIGIDVNKKRVDLINQGKTTVQDPKIEEYLNKKRLTLTATCDSETALAGADFIIIATPTDYDEDLDFFDTKSVESVIDLAVKNNKKALIIIKSTVPINFTVSMQKKYDTNRIVFSPEFLREGYALHDNLYPSRIVIGSDLPAAKVFTNLLIEAACKKDIKTLYMSSTEAESVKLFANTYLAMRVSFFNELDNFAIHEQLNARSIIEGISLDDRIGMHYNNPSFGYGGYCLPKDTKQLLANYADIPQELISAIVSSNKTRKDYISKQLLSIQPKTIGIHRLAMKAGSDNFRSSAVFDVIERIKLNNIEVLIYEPLVEKDTFFNCEVVSDIKDFKMRSDIIITNRMADELFDVEDKIFSRDVFGND